MIHQETHNVLPRGAGVRLIIIRVYQNRDILVFVFVVLCPIISVSIHDRPSGMSRAIEMRERTDEEIA